MAMASMSNSMEQSPTSLYNTRSTSVKRLMREAVEMKNPTELYYCQPIEDNLFEWHFTIRGPIATEFEQGIYHGRILFPVEYPMKPPSIILLTESGRFKTNEKICLSISGHHAETWTPTWGVRTALLAIIGFMETPGEGALGSLDYTPEERKVLAKRSQSYVCPKCGVANSEILLTLSDKSVDIQKEAKELGNQINFVKKTETKSELESTPTEEINVDSSSSDPILEPTVSEISPPNPPITEIRTPINRSIPYQNESNNNFLSIPAEVSATTKQLQAQPPQEDNPKKKELIERFSQFYEIRHELANRIGILDEYDLVILCDDSGSMNTPIHGTTTNRWDELRQMVHTIIDIYAAFDSNGVDVYFLNRPPMLKVIDTKKVHEIFDKPPSGLTPIVPALRSIFQAKEMDKKTKEKRLILIATDGVPTDSKGELDINELEMVMRNERPLTTHVTFLACTDEPEALSYLNNWDKTMINVDVVDDYRSELAEVQEKRGKNVKFTFGEYLVKALIGSIDPTMDALDE